MITGQFLIEKACPVEGGDKPEDLPFPVWVVLPAADPPTYSHEKCNGLHFRLTRESALQLGYDRSQPWVCEHMGRLIE